MKDPPIPELRDPAWWARQTAKEVGNVAEGVRRTIAPTDEEVRTKAENKTEDEERDFRRKNYFKVNRPAPGRVLKSKSRITSGRVTLR